MGGHFVRRLGNCKVKFHQRKTVLFAEGEIDVDNMDNMVLVYLLLTSFFDSVLLESQSRDDDF